MHFMNHFIRRKHIGVLVLLLTLVTSLIRVEVVFGQELTQQYRPPSPPMPVMPVIQPRPDGTVDCFDFYTFGSVKVDLVVEPRETFTGIPMQFRGELRNENPYPIVDAQVYMKVFYKDEVTASFVKQNGYPLVDFVLAVDGVSLPAKGTKPVSFTWTPPRYTAAGEYEVAFFVTSAKRSNLLGLTFTDDVTGNKFPITLKTLGEIEKPVHFDKNAVTLNRVPYRFASYPPHFGKEEGVVVGGLVVNPSAEPQTVSIVWLTSVWDGLRETSVLDRRVMNVSLEGGESKEVQYTPPTLESAVTFVSAELSFKDTTSLLNVRYVRDGVDEVRMNFPGVSSYPLKEGESVDLFSCLHSTNMPVVGDGVLTLTLEDAKGKELHTYTYTGDISSAMMGVKEAFTPRADLADFTLTATLKQGGKTIDSVSLSYRCTDIDPTLCPPDERASSAPLESRSVPLWYVALPLLVLFLVSGLLVYRARTQKKSPVTPEA